VDYTNITCTRLDSVILQNVLLVAENFSLNLFTLLKHFFKSFFYIAHTSCIYLCAVGQFVFTSYINCVQSSFDQLFI